MWKRRDPDCAPCVTASTLAECLQDVLGRAIDYRTHTGGTGGAGYQSGKLATTNCSPLAAWDASIRQASALRAAAARASSTVHCSPTMPRAVISPLRRGSCSLSGNPELLAEILTTAAHRAPGGYAVFS